MASEKLPIAESWYRVDAYPGKVTRLSEMHIDPYWSGNIWLISGSKLDLVVDTGTGVVPPNTVISTITDKPIIAVALCCFYDHAGGLYSFDERACHHLEANAITDNSNDKLASYFVQDAKFSASPYEGFDLKSYTVKSTKPTRLLEEGEIIELGNRKVEVLHIPGRTIGSIALWEEDTGYLFGGESLFLDPDKNHFPPQDVSHYENSIRRLGKLSVKTVFGGHNEVFSGKELNRLIENEIGRYN